jgi:hypothetical protein
MKKSLIIAAALLSTAAAVHAEELFVNIHSGSAMAQGAGLVLAGQALEQKATVRVLLCDAAGDIALVGKEMPTLKPRNVTPQPTSSSPAAAWAASPWPTGWPDARRRRSPSSTARKKHNYQPGYTLVATGVWPVDKVRDRNADFQPAGWSGSRTWWPSFDPAANTVVTAGGQRIRYDFLVVATGVHLDYAQIEGMDVGAIGSNGLASVYPGPQAAQATWAPCRPSPPRAAGRDDAAGHAAEVRRRAAEDDLHAARPAAPGGHAGQVKVSFQSALGNVFGVKVVNDNVLERWKSLGIASSSRASWRPSTSARAAPPSPRPKARSRRCPTTSSTSCRRCVHPTR